jgi:hypothetical protein
MIHPKRFLANKAALALGVVSLALVAATSQLSPLARVLSLESVGPAEWAVVVIGGALPAVAGQVWRWLRAGQRRVSH